MGGRTALHAALAHPAQVRGLVLIGATPGLADPAERTARRRADAELAERLLADGLPTFLDRWLALPLFAGLDEAQAARSERLANRPEGLAASLRHCGTGQQEPLWGRLGQLAVPVLAVAGDRDEKFGAIARRMVDAIGSSIDGASAEVISLPGTHAVHLEEPERTAAAVLERIDDW
jgi:2-succinyl-6-hydroxy-2,4-cyclohexadiene-1-carboxylate synthase